MRQKLKILTGIQARISSTRLPGKVMLPLNHKPLLLRLLEKVRKSIFAGKVVVLTSTNTADDELEQLCVKEGVEVFRGDPEDLLDRHYKAAMKYEADAVVKIPSDCPLISPEIIDKVIKYFLDNPGYDYVSNLHPASYPDGNDVEIFSFSSLKEAWRDASRNFEREHTTPYIWENPHKFKIGNVFWETGLDYSMSHRWTIDYPEDYAFIKSVYTSLGTEDKDFGLNEILELLGRNPELSSINSKYNGVNWYRNHLNDLKTINSSQTRRIEIEK